MMWLFRDRSLLGCGYEESLWRFFEEGKPAIDELLKDIGRESERDAVVQAYRCHKPNIHLYPGVAEMIEELKSRGIKVGIITDGRPEGQRNKIEALGLDVWMTLSSQMSLVVCNFVSRAI